MTDTRPIKIDLDAIVAERLGNKARYIPRWVTGTLKRLIRQDRLNTLLEHNFPRTGADFCDGVLEDLHVSVGVKNLEAIPSPEHRRLIIVSNHPLGGLDGMALISLFSHIYGNGVRFLVNDLLMAIKPLNDSFLPINKLGSQSRRSVSMIDSVLSGDEPVIVFPAGLVSRRQGRQIKDLEWHKMFVSKAIEYGRDVLPVYFSGRNTGLFYTIANLRKRLGLKFNYEMILLPREVFKSEGKHFEIICGKPIAHSELATSGSPAEVAARIKETVYNLAPASETNRR